jgi:hypothetical protein
VDGLWWLVILLGPLLFLQRRLHFETQAVFLLLTRSKEMAVALFSLLFLPGVLLHEMSHYLTARLLGVRTGRISLLPKTTKEGRLQLGYVETAQSDILRDALIGAAPLIVGGAFVAYAGIVHLGLPELWEAMSAGDGPGTLDSLFTLPQRADFLLWFYLVFAVSSTMLPSSSDRRAWLPVLILVGLILGISLIVGAGPWLASNVAPYVNDALRALAVVLGITVGVHLILLPPAWATRMALSRLTGIQIQ